MGKAQAILEEGARKANSASWPHNIVRYMKGEISDDELLQMASSNDKKTEHMPTSEWR
jgi:lipoprotein NlpI